MSPLRGVSGDWGMTLHVHEDGSNASPCSREGSVPTPTKIASEPVHTAWAYPPGTGAGGMLVQDIVAGSKANPLLVGA